MHQQMDGAGRIAMLMPVVTQKVCDKNAPSKVPTRQSAADKVDGGANGHTHLSLIHHLLHVQRKKQTSKGWGVSRKNQTLEKREKAIAKIALVDVYLEAEVSLCGASPLGGLRRRNYSINAKHIKHSPHRAPPSGSFPPRTPSAGTHSGTSRAFNICLRI